MAKRKMTNDADRSVIEVYERHGAAWAELRTKALVERPWLGRFCSLLPAGAAVLDTGCGAGLPIAGELLGRGFDVTAVDGAVTMIALFRDNLPATPVHLADMRALALGRRFSGLIAWDSFFHLAPADQRAMFARFEDHAEPGAALVFTSETTEGTVLGWLEGDPLHHGSLDTDDYRRLLAATGFEVVDHVVEDPACGHRTIWLARKRT